MTDFNSLLIEKINNIREEENERCDNFIKSIEESTNYIDTFILIQRFYGNTVEQAELQLQLLKENFTSEFFIKSTSKRHPNYIVFENEDYNISFSISRVDEIIVVYKNGYMYHPMARGKFKWQNFYDTVMEYKNKPSFTNIKKLIEVGYNNSSKLWLFKFIETIKLVNNDLVIKNLQKQFDDYNEQKIKDQIEKEKFEKHQQIAIDFFDSLPELKDFTDKGFNIRYKKILKDGGFEY